ncbi:RNA polymerase III subunit C53 isoform X2 [Rhynchophorus ferrugineus]|uniref:RNA polymerase III subunit C53 isoform X2 n=1 Tax=Rhynchophorus ferrugineus TaxID=354439 RepID=UPI003FCC2BF1
MEKRLQSIRLPRDLTLGGTKQKKIFTPNLNVTRNKEKKELFLKNEEKKKQVNKRNSRNNKTFEKTERYVQSSGIFSDGIGNDAIRKARYERVSAPRDDTSMIMPVPKVKKDEWQVDNKNEHKVYDEIMGCDDPSDDDEKLPFAPLPWSEADLKETKVKIDTDAIPAEFQDDDRFSDYNPALMLWSMPDSFAGKGLSDDPNIKTLFDYKLKEMLEGEIGKIQIRKSGKVEVLIGCVKYSLEPSNLQTFHEKVVEIDVEETNTEKSAVLGDIQSRFILNPDWQFLLKNS